MAHYDRASFRTAPAMRGTTPLPLKNGSTFGRLDRSRTRRVCRPTDCMRTTEVSILISLMSATCCWLNHYRWLSSGCSCGSASRLPPSRFTLHAIGMDNPRIGSRRLHNASRVANLCANTSSPLEDVIQRWWSCCGSADFSLHRVAPDVSRESERHPQQNKLCGRASGIQTGRTLCGI